MDDPRPLMMAERKAQALEVITNNADQFSQLFILWLDYNWPIWVEFERLSLEIARKRKHYAVATVWEVIRHHTLMRETTPKYKLNNNFRADVARLFALLHPQYSALFETRKRSSLSPAEAEA